MTRSLAAALAVVVIIAGVIAWRRAQRATPPLVLAPEPAAWHEVAAERNGWGLAEEAGRLAVRAEPNSDWVRRGYPDPWHPDRPEIAAHLASNRAAVAKLQEALDRPEWMRPHSLVGDPDTSLGKERAALRELARVKVQTAHQLAAAGQWSDAVAEVDGTWTMAQRFAGSGGALVDWLMARAFGAIATGHARLLLGRPPAGLDLARQAPTERWPMAPLPAAAHDALAAFGQRLADESQVLLGVQRALSAEMAYLDRRLLSADAADPSAADSERAALADWWRRALALGSAIAAQSPSQRDWRPLDRMRRPAVSRPLKQVAAGVASMIHSAANQAERAKVDQRMTRIAIALRFYLDDHGRLPNTLGELVSPRYLTELPTDPDTGGAIVYQPGKGRLYCGGADRRDGGGDRQTDYVVELPFITGRLLPAAKPSTR